jgi:hypothetical protein
MGLFSKPGGAGKPKKAKKPDSKTLIGPTVLVRIQAMVTAASGVARMPKSEEGSKAGSGYVQGLLNATPKKPELKVLAIKRGDEDTTITVGITTPNGQVVNDFTTRGVLTEDNAMATGRSIAYVLKDNGRSHLWQGTPGAHQGACGQPEGLLTRHQPATHDRVGRGVMTCRLPLH